MHYISVDIMKTDKYYMQALAHSKVTDIFSVFWEDNGLQESYGAQLSTILQWIVNGYEMSRKCYL